MTRARLNAVGYCARMTPVGDWAFQLALDLARRYDAQLDIFIFPTHPCEEHEPRGARGDRAGISDQDAIDIEREVRLYYDELLGDYVKVGFRLCLGDEAPELKRCLFGREYDVLMLAYEKRLCPFGERPIEEFADRMQCPVVLVGPGSRNEIYLNSPAELWTADLGLDDREWKPIREIPRGKPHGVHLRPAAGGGAPAEGLMSREEWSVFEKEFNESTGLHTCTYDDEGVKVTAYRKWSNLLCPLIRADKRSALTICGVPQEVHAERARREGRTVIDECEAGLLKFCVPVFLGDEYLGQVGCCGVLMEGREVDVEMVAMATGLSHEAVANLSEDIRRVTPDEAEVLACRLEEQAAGILLRLIEARKATAPPA